MKAFFCRSPFFSTIKKKMTYFDTLSRSYVDVDTNKGVDTEQFLEATEGLVKLFGKE